MAVPSLYDGGRNWFTVLSYGDPVNWEGRKNDALQHVPGLSALLNADHPLRDYQAKPCGLPGEAVYSYGDPVS